MLFSCLFVTVAALPALIKRQSGCAPYEIISARGTTEAQEKPRGSAKFIAGVQAAMPGGVNYEAVYPGTMS